MFVEMDEELRRAAVNGDVEFLRKCQSSDKPNQWQYYSSFFPNLGDGSHFGNIFHMAADNNRQDFIREAIRILPSEYTQQLLCQPREPYNANPLHIAANTGNVEIVKMLLGVYTSLSLPSDDLSQEFRPWLIKDTDGETPFHNTVYGNHEECALKIFKMDMELLCNLPTNRNTSLLFEAVHNKLTKLALEMLRSPYSFPCNGAQGYTPFHSIHYFNGSEEEKEIFRLLLQREPKLLKQINNNGDSAFHLWACAGKLWAFKFLLESHAIIPGVQRVFIDLTTAKDKYGDNPLHNLAERTSNEEVAIQIAKLLIDIYIQESSRISEDLLPWVMENNYGDTPLLLAIAHQYEKFALYILSMDENAVIKCQKNVLFLAIQKGCHKVTEKILEIVDDKGWNQLLTNQHQNVLHLAPLCTKEFCSRLIERHPELLTRVDKGGVSVLHNWIIQNSEVWLFEYILNSKWKTTFVKLIGDADYNDRNNPFHVAATTNHEATNQVVKILVEAYKEDKPSWVVNAIGMLPWFTKNKAYEGPLQLAIRSQNEQLALYLLKLHKDADDISKLLDYYEPPHSTLFLAVQNNCSQVAKYIMSRLDTKSWTKYLKDSSDGRNIMHLVPSLTDEKFGTWLVKEVPEFITQQDANRYSAWDKAYEIGNAWFIKAVLEKDPSVFDSAPLVWTKACEKGHVLALCAFINHNPEEFRDLCIEFKDSPLHHIKLKKFTGYEKFLKITPMKEFINLQDSKGATPLHKAIRNKDLLLTETLLTMDKIMYDIMDDSNVSAIDILAEECDNNQTWDRMCKRIGLDPRIKTTYFKDKTNLLDVRNSLFIVAALLATITFTAGFTLPGGFNQETGAALLGNKPAFLVFLVSDALALFFSMLVLICLTWSMVFDDSKSLVLIDRSMVLLRLAFNLTLLAFMTGVYVVIAPKSLWAAILIIVIMSCLIGISINKTFLYTFLEYVYKFIPTLMKRHKDRICDVELGTPNEHDHLLSGRGEDSN